MLYDFGLKMQRETHILNSMKDTASAMSVSQEYPSVFASLPSPKSVTRITQRERSVEFWARRTTGVAQLDAALAGRSHDN